MVHYRQYGSKCDKRTKMNEKDRQLIRQTHYFSGMSDKELDYALDFYKAKEKGYKPGDFIHRAGKPLPCFGIVLQGIVQVYSEDAEGNQQIMSACLPADTFGESLSYLKIPESPVNIVAVDKVKVLWMKPDRIINPGPGQCNHNYMNRMMEGFATRSLEMNERIQILSKRSLRQKLMTLLGMYRRKSGEKTFDIPLSREDMAVYLGCDRSALSRELSNMKNEGLIDYYRSTFRLL